MFRGIVSLLAAVALATPWAASAEETFTVTGKAMVMGEKIPLEGATVFVAERDDIPTALSERDGSFRLDLPAEGEYKISASMVGFGEVEPQAVQVSTQKPAAQVKLYLAPAREFTEVVVTAERNQDQVGKRTVSGEEMRQIPGSMGDPIRALTNLPGMAQAGAGFMSSPAIRGSSPSDNVFYVDGIETVNLFHIGFSSIFNPDMVEDFNLYLSSPGPEFREAQGGVIDLKLRDPKKDRFSYRASVSLTEVELLAEGPLAEGHSLAVTARRSYIDLIVGPIIKKMGAQNGVKVIQFPWYYDYMAKYVWDISARNKLSVLAHGTQDKTIIEITEEASGAKHDPALVGDFDIDMLSNVQGASLTTMFTDNIKNTLILSRRSYTQKMAIASALSADNVFADMTAREQLEARITETNTLTLGAEEGRSDIKMYFEGKAWAPNQFEPQKDVTSQQSRRLDTTIKGISHAAYIKDRWSLTEKLTLVAGGRWMTEDYLKETYTMPRASMEIRPAEGLLLTAGWGQYVQFPQGSYVVEVFGNPEMAYEKSVHNTLGLKKKLWEGAWDVGVETYYKTFSDLAVPDKEKNYINGGSGDAYGFEVLLRKNRKPETSVYGWLAFTYSHSTRKNDITGESFSFAYDQPVIINAVAAWRLPIWTLSGRFYFASGRPFTPVTGTFKDETGRIRPIYGPLGSERLPHKHQLDIRLDRTIRYNEWKLAIYFDVQNVYWSKNINGYVYNDDYSKREPAPGLPPLVAFGVESTF